MMLSNLDAQKKMHHHLPDLSDWLLILQMHVEIWEKYSTYQQQEHKSNTEISIGYEQLLCDFSKVV
ncbi:hypothetical protein [Pedobacter sp.]|uniref:hypothetical protein n=1 Tax=Pedobacter sp. TaxID=1411316 RepID=UPI003BAA6109